MKRIRIAGRFAIGSCSVHISPSVASRGLIMAAYMTQDASIFFNFFFLQSMGRRILATKSAEATLFKFERSGAL